MRIRLHVISNDAGGMAVLTPEHRLNATLRALRRRATKLRTESDTLSGAAQKEALEEAKSYEKLADETAADWLEIQNKYADTSTVLEFEIRAYTYGEKLAARKAATTWNGNVPGRNWNGQHWNGKNWNGRHWNNWYRNGRWHGPRYRYRYPGYNYFNNGFWYPWPWWSYNRGWNFEVGDAFAGGSYASNHVQWCMNRYRSYNPRTDTYTGYDGKKRRCRGPY